MDDIRIAEQRKPTTMQTLIFSKKVFKTAAAAKAWAKDHDRKSGDVDETGDSFRLRQAAPGRFTPGSFRTINITNGVKAVIGKLKESEAVPEDNGPLNLSERISFEGGKYVLRSKDGSKILGRFGSKAEAKKHEGRIQAFKQKEGEIMIGLAKLKDGKVVLAEGGRIEAKDIQEAELQRLTDEQLKTMRKAFIAARMKIQKKHSAINDSAKFSTPLGQQTFADIEYYNGIIRRVEWEMTDRYLVLD